MHAMIGFDTIEASLKGAFPTRPVPSQLFLDGLRETRNWDIPMELQNRLLGREWTEVTLMDWRCIGSIGSIITYVTPTAFRYYLPSLLWLTAQDPSWLELGI